ncbi:hypothetical protein B0H63DRAFT_267843 [Podospora didyma]|uniref:Uncharacterized protein n=1 Tax=Podospora didyma TaxID=330526 RepID=A0AAE0KFN2_9PEZI|nr:hypothetical protein B0H63DRAFT_267843 [Podospora didyma]
MDGCTRRLALLYPLIFLPSSSHVKSRHSKTVSAPTVHSVHDMRNVTLSWDHPAVRLLLIDVSSIRGRGGKNQAHNTSKQATYLGTKTDPNAVLVRHRRSFCVRWPITWYNIVFYQGKKERNHHHRCCSFVRPSLGANNPKPAQSEICFCVSFLY